jgi:hypothetical protein
MLGEEAVDREDARFDAAARATQAPRPPERELIDYKTSMITD